MPTHWRVDQNCENDAVQSRLRGDQLEKLSERRSQRSHVHRVGELGHATGSEKLSDLWSPWSHGHRIGLGQQPNGVAQYPSVTVWRIGF